MSQTTILTVQDLWQAHYQIFSIILVKELIKSNVKTVVHVVCFEYKNVKDDSIEFIKCLCYH